MDAWDESDSYNCIDSSDNSGLSVVDSETKAQGTTWLSAAIVRVTADQRLTSSVLRQFHTGITFFAPIKDEISRFHWCTQRWFTCRSNPCVRLRSATELPCGIPNTTRWIGLTRMYSTMRRMGTVSRFRIFITCQFYSTTLFSWIFTTDEYIKTVVNACLLSVCLVEIGNNIWALSLRFIVQRMCQQIALLKSNGW